MVKEIIIFSAGAVSGILGTALFLDKKYKARTEEEVASMKEYVARVREKEMVAEATINEGYDTDDGDAVKPRDNSSITMVNKGESYKPGSLAGTTHIDYSKFYGKDPAEGEYPSEEEDEYYNAKKFNDRTKDKHGSEIITPEEMDNFPQYDKVLLYYYAYNDIMVYGEPENEEQEIIEDIDELLGNCWYESGFAAVDEEKDVLCIRNYDRATDYEIQKIFATFELN